MRTHSERARTRAHKIGCKDTKKIPHTQEYAGFFLFFFNFASQTPFI